jgi:hypothetical protein
MSLPHLALSGAAALMGAAATLTCAPPVDRDSYEAAYAVSATGQSPLSAGPHAFSASGSVRAEAGSVRSADGHLTVGWARAFAGAGRAGAVAYDVTALGGAVRASSVTAQCRNGSVTSDVVGGMAHHLRGRASVLFDVRSTSPQGRTTVIGLQIRIRVGGGTVINIASATCGPKPVHICRSSAG